VTAPLPRFRIYTTPTSYLSAFRDLLLGKALEGDDVRRFEQEIALFTGLSRAVAMPMARTGIYLILRHVIKPGQKVICSPITIVDVINMIICAGGVPVFADVERGTCNIDPERIERLIDADTGAVFITHLHGLACDMDRIVELCNKRGIPLIEDAAQAFSTRHHGRPVGGFGLAGVLSFGMYKNVNAFYGGMVMTNDAALGDALRRETASFAPEDLVRYLKKALNALSTDIATHPLLFRLFTFWLFKTGYLRNIDLLNKMVTVDLKPELTTVIPPYYLRQMTPMQARIASSQLERVETNNQARTRAARLYYEGLKDIPELILPPMRDDGSHTYTYYPIHCPDRHALMRHALLHNRDFVLSHYRNCASLPCFRTWAADCPEAEHTSTHLIYLPTYPRYTEPEIRKNIDVIRSLYRPKRGASQGEA